MIPNARCYNKVIQMPEHPYIPIGIYFAIEK